MATATTRLSTSYASMKSSNLHELIQKFYTIVEKLKQSHENEIDVLHQRIGELESENKHLRNLHEQHPHSIFDINYISNDSITIDQLRSELDRTHKQMDELQRALNEAYSIREEANCKYTARNSLKPNHAEEQNSTSDSNRIQELESKIQQIKDQIHQFDQYNYETNEQIRLLKQILSTNDAEQMRTITQSLTVKQADLLQQTDIVENLLHKQETKILEKLIELLDQNPRHDDHPTTSKTKKPKRKRL